MEYTVRRQDPVIITALRYADYIGDLNIHATVQPDEMKEASRWRDDFDDDYVPAPTESGVILYRADYESLKKILALSHAVIESVSRGVTIENLKAITAMNEALDFDDESFELALNDQIRKLDIVDEFRGLRARARRMEGN